MKKYLSFFLALTLVFSMFAVCGIQASADDDRTLTFAFWEENKQAWWDYVYEETGITVEYEKISSGDYASIMTTRVKGGTAPDMFYSRTQDVGEMYAQNGYVRDNEELREYVDTYFNPNALAGAKEMFGDTLYAVPDYTSYVNILYYNKDMFEEYGIDVPTNINEFFDVCEKFTELGITPMINGAATLSNFSYVTLVPAAIWIANNHADYMKGLATGESSLLSEEGTKAFQYYCDGIQYMSEDSIGITHVEAWEMFAEGGIPMITGESWCLDQNYATVPTSFELGVAPVPYNYEGEPHVVLGGKSLMLFINAASEKQDLAIEYYKFWLSHLKEYATLTGRPAAFVVDDGEEVNWSDYSHYYTEIASYPTYSSCSVPSAFVNDYYSFLQGVIAGNESMDTLPALQEKLEADMG